MSKNLLFAKTGSGQTQGNLKKETVFLQFIGCNFRHLGAYGATVCAIYI